MIIFRKEKQIAAINNHSDRLNLPVVVVPNVRAVAGFDVVVDVRVAPTVDFVTVLVVVVVFFVRVDVAPAAKSNQNNQMNYKFLILGKNHRKSTDTYCHC